MTICRFPCISSIVKEILTRLHERKVGTTERNALELDSMPGPVNIIAGLIGSRNFHTILLCKICPYLAGQSLLV